MNCRKCGNAIGAGLKFCTRCGTPVEAAPPAPSEPPPAPSVPAAPPAPACSKCGAPLKPGLRFCTACGTHVEPAPAPKAGPDDKTTEVEVLAPPPPKSIHETPTAEMAARSVETKPKSVEIPSKVKRVNNGPRCAECGAAMLPTSRICFACGARVGQSKPAAPVPPVSEAATAPKTAETKKPVEAAQKVENAKSVEPSKPATEEKASRNVEPPPAAAPPKAVDAAPRADTIQQNEPAAAKPESARPDEQPAKDPAPVARATDVQAISTADSEAEVTATSPAPTEPVSKVTASVSSVCLRCGGNLIPGERFCTRCGAVVAVPGGEVGEAVGAPPAGAPTEVENDASDERPLKSSAGAGVPQEAEAAAARSNAEPEPAPAESASQVCTRCGAELSPGLRFCTGCGTLVVAQAEQSAGEVSGVATEEVPAAEEVAIVEAPAETLVGAALIQEEAATDYRPKSEPAAAAPATNAGVCAKCGTPASAGVRFCIGCGAPVEWWHTGGVAGSHASKARSPAPAPIQRKGISAGVLVAIFMVLLLVLAGCAFWLWRSMQYSPSTDIAIVQIPEDGAAEPEDGAAGGSEIPAEDSEQLVEQTGAGSDTASAQNTAASERAGAAGAVGGSPTGRPAPASSGSSTPAGSASPGSRKSTSPPTSTTKAAQTAQNTAPAPRSPVPFVDDPPPSNTRQPSATPSDGTATSPPPAAPVTQPSTTPVQPAEPAAPAEGIIFWTGKLQRNKRFIISTKGTDYGFADGAMLPGTPVEIRVLSPAVRVVESPGPNNSWQRVILECTRNTNQTVTINVQWFAAR